MSQDITADDATHDAESINTIVVDADDVLEAMRRNKRDENEQRNHVLRVSPPFDGTHTATLHVSETHSRYPSEMDPTPIHLSPEAFLTGSTEPQARIELSSIHEYPDYSEQFAEFKRQTVGLDEWERLSDDERESYREDFENEWLAVHLDEWEGHVRHALDTLDELTITNQHPDIDDTTVSVQVEGL